MYHHAWIITLCLLVELCCGVMLLLNIRKKKVVLTAVLASVLCLAVQVWQLSPFSLDFLKERQWSQEVYLQKGEEKILLSEEERERALAYVGGLSARINYFSIDFFKGISPGQGVELLLVGERGVTTVYLNREQENNNLLATDEYYQILLK